MFGQTEAMANADACHEVLIVDDDNILLRRVKAALESADYICFTAESGDQMSSVLATRNIGAIILDLGLPDADGMDELKAFREVSKTPVIVMTSRTDIDDRLEALNVGADDYIIKPCDLREVVARLGAVLRRNVSTESGKHSKFPTMIADWRLDTVDMHLVNANHAAIKLSQKEFELLVILAQHAGKTLSRGWLLYALHQRNWAPGDRTVDNMVSRLRKKLFAIDSSETVIATDRIHGYRLTLPVSYSD